jgi:hypothetical protein
MTAVVVALLMIVAQFGHSAVTSDGGPSPERPCREVRLGGTMWASVVQFEDDEREDEVPTNGLVDFFMHNGKPYGLYIDTQGCLV